MKISNNLELYAVVIIALLVIIGVLMLSSMVLRRFNIGKIRFGFGKANISLTQDLDDCVLAHQMRYAYMKSKTTVQEQMSLVADKLALQEEDDAYVHYYMILNHVVDRMLDLYRECFKLKTTYTRDQDEVIRDQEEYMFQEARMITSKWYRTGIMKMPRDEMIGKCAKGLREIFAKTHKDTMIYAIKLYRECKK